MILLVICGTELVAGVVLLVNSASSTSVQVVGYAVVTSLLVGIGRAWEFIGERDTGLMASLGILAGRADTPDATGAADGGQPDADSAGHPAPEHRTGPAEPADSDDEPG